MGRCPLYKCTNDKRLIMSDTKYFFCKDSWDVCPLYSHEKHIVAAKKGQRNMKIGIVLGIVLGFIIGILIGEGMIGAALIGSIIGAIYGLGFSSILKTLGAIEDIFDKEGCCIVVVLYPVLIPIVVGLGITTIVGIVGFFKRQEIISDENK